MGTTHRGTEPWARDWTHTRRGSPDIEKGSVAEAKIDRETGMAKYKIRNRKEHYAEGFGLPEHVCSIFLDLIVDENKYSEIAVVSFKIPIAGFASGI